MIRHICVKNKFFFVGKESTEEEIKACLRVTKAS